MGNPACAPWRFGVAVSGGADSVSLLVSLARVFGGARLYAITVDHNIRAAGESAGDAAFVQDLCARFGVPCDVTVLPPGRVREAAQERGGGTEEAARFLRYEAFAKFLTRRGLPFLCLAHTQDDQLETLVMRFLQGSGLEGGGICAVRGAFVRPLLGVPRSAIESYLRSLGIPWRTDSTNADTAYTRNRIRSVLMPVLDAEFPGWRGAALLGNEKDAADELFLRAAAKTAGCWRADSGGVFMDGAAFFSAHLAVRRRLLFAGLDALGAGGRFPYKVARTVLSWHGAARREISACGVRIRTDGVRIVLEHLPADVPADGRGFCAVFERPGDRTDIGGTVLSVREWRGGFALLADSARNGNGSATSIYAGLSDNGTVDSAPAHSAESIEPGGSTNVVRTENGTADFGSAVPLCRVALPCCVRNAQAGDRVGGSKAVSSLFTSWHVDAAARAEIPVVQELATQEIIAVLGSVAGAPDWVLAERRA